MVLLGGNAGAAGQYSDMWRWNGATWAPLSATLPSGWGLPLRAAYDDATSSVVAVSCVLQSPMTYVFNGTSWQQYPAAGLPCAPAIGHDTKRSVVVAFGGNSGQVSKATWTWDGSRWTQKAPAHSPPPRALAVAAFDVTNAELIVFGGSEPYGAQNMADVATTWAWSGTDWTQVAS